MTARVLTLKGDTAGAYYVEQPGRYYLDGDEPDGVWRGGGAEALGLYGFDEEAFLALMAGLDPRTGELIGTKHDDRSVRGFDVTFSAPKSMSVLFAVGDPTTRAEALAAHDAAVNAVIDWIEVHATVRHRVNGEVWNVDAEGIVAGLFRQHTSRALDPQVHTHAVIINRVLAPDGRWLALDARTIKRDQRTLSALYHASLRGELTRRLGVEWETPVNGIAEMANIDPDVLGEFSKRTTQMDERLEDKLDRFATDLGRMPTLRERWKLEREAAVDSRPSKTRASAAELHDQWVDQVRALGIEPTELVEDLIGRAHQLNSADVDVEAVIGKALASISERQSTWRPAEVTRELAAALPTGIAMTAAEVTEWAEALTGIVVRRDLVDLFHPIADGAVLRRDGRPVTESALDRILTTPDILAQEERLIVLAEERIGRGGIDRAVTVSEELSGVQARAAAAVAGERELTLIVGPAGTGKTTALSPAVEQLRHDGRAVFGVCLAASAADVLSTETGVDADTLDKLLIEHRIERPPEHRYNLPPGATVIVDEAAMVSTGKLAELFDLAEARSWRLALVGDPMQFSAVGRSGMFGHLVDTFGAIELDRVRRFSEPWERDASLRLRHGDSDVAKVYDDHGRLHGGTAGQMRGAVVDAWWVATHGGHTAAMMAPTGEAIAELNAAAQQRRVDAGELDTDMRLDLGDGRFLLIGDEVATRRNDRTLRTDRNVMVRNRDRWVVKDIHPDHTLTVSGRSGTIRLPADYATSQVELAYAETSHAAQGRTVDRSFHYLDAPTDTPGIYVPMTRGRDTNEAFVVLTEDTQSPADVIAESVARTWIDRPAVAQRLDLEPLSSSHRDPDGIEVPPPTVLDGPEIARLIASEAQLTRDAEHGRRQVINLPTAMRELAALAQQRVTLTARLDDTRGQVTTAQETVDRYDHRLVRHVHRNDIDDARHVVSDGGRTIDRLEGEISGIDRSSEAIRQRIDQCERAFDTLPGNEADLAETRTALDGDLAARVDQLPTDPAYQTIIDQLGPEPHGQVGGQLWRTAAGHIAQHAAAYGLADDRLVDRYLGPQCDHRQQTEQAIADYDNVMGRTRLERSVELEHGIDPPGLGL